MPEMRTKHEASPRCHGAWLKQVAPCAKVADKPASRTMGVIPGEGVGPEVIAAALKVLDAVESVRPLAIVRHQADIEIGTAVNPDGILTQEPTDFCEQLFAQGAPILCGPGGGRFVYDLRRRFDLFCKLAPIRPVPALRHVTRIKEQWVRGIDILIVRDNAGGVYQGQWAGLNGKPNSGVAQHAFSYSEAQVQQIIAAGARLAQMRSGRMHVIIKDGGVPTISDLWRQVATRVAKGAAVQCVFQNVDYAAYAMIQHPQQFDVLVTPNLLGDILADLGAVFLGSRGLSFSGNFSAEGHAVYQTGHGAAQDLAGTDRVNPIGQILSLAMMLRESYGEGDAAGLIERSVEDVYQSGYRTDDLAEPSCRCVGTAEMAELVAKSVVSLSQTAVPA